MGKSKQQNRKPDEELLGENRLYRKQIRKLQQEIVKLRKELGYSQNKTIEEQSDKESKKEKCLECGKGDILIMDIGIRRYSYCTLCSDKKRLD